MQIDENHIKSLKGCMTYLDGSYQGRKKLTFLWPSPHRRPNLTKYEQICRKTKIEQMLPNIFEN